MFVFVVVCLVLLITSHGHGSSFGDFCLTRIPLVPSTFLTVEVQSMYGAADLILRRDGQEYIFPLQKIHVSGIIGFLRAGGDSPNLP